jgi:hypothetical protein
VSKEKGKTMEKLIQNRLYKKQVLRLTEDKVIIEEKNIFIKKNYAINYYELHPEPIEEKDRHLIFIAMFIMFLIITIDSYFRKDNPDFTLTSTGYYIHAAVCIIILFCYFLTLGKRIVFIAEPLKLEIYDKIPNKESVDAFIKTMLEKRKVCLKDNFLNTRGEDSSKTD